MTLTDYLTRLLAVIAFGAAALVPALGLTLADPAAAGPGDDITNPTLDPCQTGESLDCPPPEPPCPKGTFPIPVPDGNGGIKKVKCVPCENLPVQVDACPPTECDPEVEDCEPPECDPEVEDCDPPPECDPQVEKCDEEPPGGDPDPEPDQPVPGRPTFTG